ncbi:hypothetical protein [Jiulongibacter sediminis]|uniref:Uncharacterized protein n=1 Tax=Jiulongibacter sediminis TaxID=1605367 RepID=A0A0P7BYN8_9BACT|nr:hypothetical protein [Jiulongibacter sediminis]KPM50019.1 hypothetical protein AFM12_05570 [Jiulongibacter sediminis]TBX27047.1 hypothetical protein TK44_05575 [Jiulongibacter sediminis]
MIDGFKILNLRSEANLHGNSNLFNNWETKISKDGEIKYHVQEFKSLVFINKPPPKNCTSLRGSLHKYYNKGIHNHDDFYFQQVCDTIDDLSKRFNLNLHKCHLNNLEFGVNLKLNDDVSKLLLSLISYRGSIFNEIREDNISYFQCRKSQYIVKIYNKGLQYQLKDNVLRFEVKVTRMQFLKSRGIPISTLHDLKNKKIITELGNLLVEIFSQIVFAPVDVDFSLMSKKEKILFFELSNPHYWRNNDTSAKAYKRKQRNKKKFIELQKSYSNEPFYHAAISYAIKEKWNSLFVQNLHHT